MSRWCPDCHGPSPSRPRKRSQRATPASAQLLLNRAPRLSTFLRTQFYGKLKQKAEQGIFPLVSGSTFGEERGWGHDVSAPSSADGSRQPLERGARESPAHTPGVLVLSSMGPSVRRGDLRKAHEPPTWKHKTMQGHGQKPGIPLWSDTEPVPRPPEQELCFCPSPLSPWIGTMDTCGHLQMVHKGPLDEAPRSASTQKSHPALRG